jgi:hypothetical protein
MIRTNFRLAHDAPTYVAPPPAFPFYVNTVTGTSGGTGEIGSPHNSLQAALDRVAGYPDWLVKVVAPSTSPLRQEVIHTSGNPVIVEGVDDTPWFIKGSDVLTSWTGTGPVYSKSLGWTLVGTVVVPTLTDTIGGVAHHCKLKPNTTTPTTPASGEWGYTGGTLYVRLPDDSNPASHTIEAARRNTCIATRALGLLTVRDVDARLANNAALMNGLSDQPAGSGLLTVEDSFVGYTGTGGNGVGQLGQSVHTICTRVTSHRNGNDGFNLHENPSPLIPQPVMTLNDCDGSFNGDVVGSSAQGASNHAYTKMVINGGTFDYNVSGGMVVIDNAVCEIHGDTEYGPVTMGHNMRLGNTAGTIASQASCAWLNSSTGVVTGSVTVHDGQGTGVRTAVTGAVPGVLGIVSTGNAVADSIA